MNKITSSAFRKLLSLVVAMVMVFGLVPAGQIAMADKGLGAAEAGSEVVNGQYVDGVWQPGGTGVKQYTVDANGNTVELSKTATPVTGAENTYQVTLQVVTSTSTSQVVSSENGAVVLVIDLSNSMKWCAECGGNGSHNNDCSHYTNSGWWGSGNSVTTEQTRLYAAKAAARNFISTYAGTDASAVRELAIVVFDTDYRTELSWVNVAGGSGSNSYNTAISTVNNLSIRGGNHGATNLEGGLYETLARLSDDAVAGINAKSVVVLTDGAPTKGLNNQGNGSEGSAVLNQNAALMAANVKELATLYTVCFGAANNYTYSGGPTVGSFLANQIATSPEHAYDADNADQLTVAFEQITETITQGLSGEGWNVTDPMGNYVSFAEGPAGFTSADGRTFTWVLSDAYTTNNGNTTVYVYTCTYTVTVNVQAEGFVEGQYYPVNGHTYLNIGNDQYEFPVPGVTGCLPRTSVTVHKVWNDNGNQDGIRPGSVTVQLMKDGAPLGDPVVVTAANNWQYTWTDLVAMSNGVQHVYTVVEVGTPEGYTAAYTGVGTHELTITNDHEVEKTDITVTKVWNDNNDQDGIRPDHITVALLKAGAQIATGTLTAANGWSYTFAGLDKNENGQPIVYTVEEIDVPEGYTASVDDLVITNTHSVAKTEVGVSKVWDDDNNRDGVRPTYITVKLFADGVDTGVTMTLSEGNNWTAQFTGLDMFSNGSAIIYTVEEVPVPGYTAAVAGSMADGYTITNTHVPEVVTVSGHKTWIDNDDQDGVRPDSITIALRAEGGLVASAVVTAADGWAWSFTDLPKYENGHIINYVIVESAVEDYSTTYDGYNVINTHTPAKTSVTVTKDWDDNNNQDGVRPNHIVVKLLANGVETGETMILSAGNNWTGSFTELDKFIAGAEISYSVGEVAIEGYTTVVTGDQHVGYTITNTHVPAVTEVSGHKIWNDNDNQDGVRPESITIALRAEGGLVASAVVTAADGWAWSFTDLPKYENGHIINYVIVESAVPGYTTEYDGFNVINTHASEKTSVTVTKAWHDNDDQDGIRPNSVTVALLANGVATGQVLMLNPGNGWTGVFTDLDKFAAGSEIIYSVAEVEVPGYVTVIGGSQYEGYTVTNCHIPAVTEVNGHKIWNDNNDQDGARPDAITVNLLKNGHVVDTQVVTAANGWAWSFVNLPMYENHGTPIVYTVAELGVEGYTTEYNGYDITNTHTPAKTGVTVTKAWEDSNNQDGSRPNDVTVELYANGMPTGMTLVLNSGNNWHGSFSDLDMYAGGAPVNYTVVEAPVPGYEVVITGTQQSGYVITNSHIPAVTEVNGCKIWFDNDNQDGVRPESIVVNLLANGQVIDTQVVTAANGWAWSFTNLPMYEAGGVLINYTVVEEPVEGYYTMYCFGMIKNFHEPEKTSVTVTKAWHDNNDQDGIRPNYVTVALFANGFDTGRTVVLNAGNNWQASFEGLDKYYGGSPVVYTVAEAPVPDYLTTVTGNQNEGYVITNCHTPATVDVCGCKEWFDNNDQDGVRPDSITVHLLANGHEVASMVVTAETNWAFCFENMPKYDHGMLITYTFAEDAVEGYTTMYCFNCIKNFHETEKVNVNVNKVWEDSYNQDGIRPNHVTITLFANGVPTGMTLVLNSGNNWQGAFEGLDKYAGGVEVNYTVAEAPVPGYETVITGSAAEGYTVTNSHTPALTCVCGHKTWMDNFDQDGARPESITIHLLANGQVIATQVVTAAEGWAWSFEGLPMYQAEGVLINYTVTEEGVEGYYTTYCGWNITNCHAPEKTSVTVTKAWFDNFDQDGIRPGFVTIGLLANGMPTGQTMMLSPVNNWTGSFTDLPKYANGQEIEYTVAEVPVPGYVTVITGDQNTGFVVTNTHAPCVTNVCGQKLWFDNDNQDGARPESITIYLLANGVVVDSIEVTADMNWEWCFTDLPVYMNHGMPIVYTFAEAPVEGYYTVYCFNFVKNFHDPEKTAVNVSKVWEDNGNQDGIRPGSVTVELYANGIATGMTILLNEDNNWQGAFENLDKYAGGVEIEYTVVEAPVPGYETVVSGTAAEGYVITNSHTPETIAISGAKTWVDNDDQDGVRPESIQIVLRGNGGLVASVIVTAEDGWAWSFTDLPKYENGVEINYTITEAVVDEYSTEYNGWNVINTHTPAKTSVTVTKVWMDGNNQDGIRPNDVTVELVANGVPTGMTLVLNEGNNWMGSFTELDKFANGVEIVYTVAEVTVPGYETVITGTQADGYTITNCHTPEVVEIAGAKTWVDNDNQDGVRPESITINLLANGVVIDTVTVTAEDGWAWSFTNLPKYENGGQLINYSIVEAAVDGYVTTYNNYNAVNTHAPEKTSVTVTKAWDDAGNQDGIRPGYVTVHLYANGVDTGMSLMLGEGNNWFGTFTDLDKYAAGLEIDYTVVEDEVEGYTTFITGSQAEGYVVTNIHVPEVIEIAGAKTWVDNDNQDGVRPDSIVIHVYANGELIISMTVTEGDGWAWRFVDLPKYENGVEINYTIMETAVEDYSTEYDGFNIINTHTPAKTSVSVLKAWEDNEDQDGIRPESVTVELLANDVPTGMTLVLNEDNNWMGSFTELDKFANGVEIVYSVAEVAVEGYATVITGSQTEGFVITNSHTPDVIDIAGGKTWDDENNQDGVRPESITIRLYADGELVEVIEVTAEDDWAWSFTNLPKYRDHGVEIVYTISEDAVEGYVTEYDGFDVTNHYDPEEISITVIKRWEGDNTKPKNSGHRVPVTIHLYADGVEIDHIVLDEENNWTGVFTGLPKYRPEGELIEYTISEDEVEYYTTIINGNVEEGFVVTNTHIPVPGDERTAPTLWIGLMVASVVAMGGAAVYVTRRKKTVK